MLGMEQRPGWGLIGKIWENSEVAIGLLTLLLPLLVFLRQKGPPSNGNHRSVDLICQVHHRCRTRHQSFAILGAWQIDLGQCIDWPYFQQVI